MVVYTPSAKPGTWGTDTFTVSDKDGAGVTTKTELQFSVDGGTAVTYGQTSASTSPVVVTPTLISPKGPDSFSFASGGSTSLTLTGEYGTAKLSTSSGAIIYTPTAPPGTAGTDHFTVYDTDMRYVTTSSVATFVVENYVAPTISGTLAGQTTTSEQTVTPFSGVTVTDINVGATDTLTIALIGQGALSGPGLSLTNEGYTLSGSAQTISSELHALVFTPAAGADATQHATTFVLKDASSLTAATVVDSTTSVTDFDPAVAPLISGTHGGQLTSSEAPLEPFAQTVITDTNANAKDILSITLVGTGSLSGQGLSGSNGNYTLSGSAAEITQQLEALVFAPAAGAPGTQHTTTFVLSDQSSATTTTATDSTTSVTDVDLADSPIITGAHGHQLTTSEAPLKPFAQVEIADPNAGATDTLTIALTGSGSLSGDGLSGSNGSYTLTGSASDITTALKAIVFTPAAGQPATQHTTVFTLTDASSATSATAINSATSVTDVDPAVAPKITGTLSGQQTTSEATIAPFAHVRIHDANANAIDTLTITLTGGGALSGAGLSLSNGNYTLTGSATKITAELDALVFTPTAGAAATQHTTTFTLTDISSATTTSAIDVTTSVTNVDPTVAPTITGTQHGQQTTSEAPLNPFAHVTITDANSGASDTLTIALAGGGALAGAGLVGSDGRYTLTGSATDITAELKALVFTPAAGAPGTHHTTTFNLTDESTATTATATDTTTSVRDVDPAGPLVLSVPVSTIELTQAQATSIAGLSLSESGASAGEVFVVGLHATYGHLSVIAQSGATTAVNDSDVLTIEGSLAGVNATLATLTDTDYHTGNDTIAVAAADTNGLVALPQTIAVHDAGLHLEVSAPASANIPLGVASAIGPILSIAVVGAASDDVFTVGVTGVHGQLAMTAQGLARVHGNNAGVLVAKGSLADVNATLQTLTDTDQQAGGDTLQIFAADSYGNHESNVKASPSMKPTPPTISGAASGQQTISEATAQSVCARNHHRRQCGRFRYPDDCLESVGARLPPPDPWGPKPVTP